MKKFISLAIVAFTILIVSFLYVDSINEDNVLINQRILQILNDLEVSYDEFLTLPQDLQVKIQTKCKEKNGIFKCKYTIKDDPQNANNSGKEAQKTPEKEEEEVLEVSYDEFLTLPQDLQVKIQSKCKEKNGVFKCKHTIKDDPQNANNSGKEAQKTPEKEEEEVLEVSYDEFYSLSQNLQIKIQSKCKEKNGKYYCKHTIKDQTQNPNNQGQEAQKTPQDQEQSNTVQNQLQISQQEFYALPYDLQLQVSKCKWSGHHYKCNKNADNKEQEAQKKLEAEEEEEVLEDYESSEELQISQQEFYALPYELQLQVSLKCYWNGKHLICNQNTFQQRQEAEKEQETQKKLEEEEEEVLEDYESSEELQISQQEFYALPYDLQQHVSYKCQWRGHGFKCQRRY